MTNTTAAQPQVNLFDLFDGADLTEDQRGYAYSVYTLTRQLQGVLNDMARDIERAQRQLAAMEHQLMASSVSPQSPIYAAVLNTQLQNAHKEALESGVTKDLLAQVTLAGIQSA